MKLVEILTRLGNKVKGIEDTLGKTTYNSWGKDVPQSVETELGSIQLDAGSYVILATFSWYESVADVQNMALYVDGTLTRKVNNAANAGGGATVGFVTTQAKQFTLSARAYNRNSKTIKCNCVLTTLRVK